MRVILKNQEFDTLLLPIEWRYSASVVGLVRFFDYLEEKEDKKLYYVTKRGEHPEVYEAIGGYIEGIKYNQAELTEKRYLDFCEYYFSNDFQHVLVKKKLNYSEEFSDEQIGEINNLLTGKDSNSILKKTFDKKKFDGFNKDIILEILETNRNQLIKETFRNKKSLYRNFANTNKLLSDVNQHCRLLGYDIDENRKSKSISYRFDTDTFMAQDIKEFDFIPFAFTHTYVGFFVNNNRNIRELVQTNNRIEEIMSKENEIRNNKEIRDGEKTKLIKGMIELNSFFDFDVEIIQKDRNNELFDTLFLRKNSLKRLKEIYQNHNLRFVHQYNFNYYLNVEEELIYRCMNNVLLDDLIERLLVISRMKDKEYASRIIEKLIDINVSWKEVQNLNEITTRAKSTGYYVGQALISKSGENKARSYKNKLINAIVAHDYDRVKEIILQLSGFLGREISTIYDMIDYPELASDIAISFANSIVPFKSSNE